MKSNVKRDNNISYTIALSDDGNYIEMKVFGVITRNLAAQQNLEAHALGRKLGITRYLIDVTNAKNMGSSIDTYRFANEDMKTTPRNRLARFALLVSPDDPSHNFFETVLRNAGFNVTLFRDRKAAVKYLLKEV